MAAPVLPVAPLKLPAGPSPSTPDQSYWRGFKDATQIPSASNASVTHISCPSTFSQDVSLLSSCDLFAVTTGVRVQLYSSRTRKLEKTISRFSATAHSGELRRDGRVLVASDESGKLQVFDTSSRAILKTWTEHRQGAWVARFDPTDPTRLMSASDDTTVRLWDLPSDESVRTLYGHTDYVRSGAFLPGQAAGLLVSGSYDRTVRIWDPRAANANAVMTFQHAEPVEAVLPMPAGTTLLAAAGPQVVVLDLVAGKPLTLLRNHQKAVSALALASQGSRMLAGGLDGHVKVYETSTWNPVYTTKYSAPVLSLAVVPAPDGSGEDRHLAVGLASGVLSLRTRLSGTAKVQHRTREREMQALLAGRMETLERKKTRRQRDAVSSATRLALSRDADIVVQPPAGDRRSRRARRPQAWEQALHDARYGDALDRALDAFPRFQSSDLESPNSPNHSNSNSAQTKSTQSKSKSRPDPTAVPTVFTALRHRSALRTALSNRSAHELLPVLHWVRRHVADARYVGLCIEVLLMVLDLYAGDIAAGVAPRPQPKTKIEVLVRAIHARIRAQVEVAHVACQTHGMLDLVAGSH